MRRYRAFTLIELMVVVMILGLLISILLPALSQAKTAADCARCLSNMRNLEVAHWMYMTANGGSPIRAGMAHGGAHGNEQVAWINTLQRYYGDRLLARCPCDRSPHWPGGTPISGTTDQYRRCSYGINEFTDPELCPWGGPYDSVEKFPNPARIVHFVEMAETGEYAGADHPHVDLWVGNILAKASGQLEIHQHGGTTRSWKAVANYGFLDGHAESLPFEKAFKSRTENRFDPALAR